MELPDVFNLRHMPPADPKPGQFHLKRRGGLFPQPARSATVACSRNASSAIFAFSVASIFFRLGLLIIDHRIIVSVYHDGALLQSANGPKMVSLCIRSCCRSAGFRRAAGSTGLAAA
jgi:hypothetical protein